MFPHRNECSFRKLIHRVYQRKGVIDTRHQRIRLLIIFLFLPLWVEATTFLVKDSVIGKSPKYIGANEGGIFDVKDLVDCGINCYRIWTSMAELEWVDDDGVYGWPTIAEIKTNPDIIDWTYWDSVFSCPRWSYSASPISFGTIIDKCVTHNIEPILVLRNRDQNGWPPWTPNPPTSAADWNEWWEYCFAIAYWCNIRNHFGITHFQVLNEPDIISKGWGGDTIDYVLMAQYATDACGFANTIAGLPVHIHAPVTANYRSPYIPYSLRHADSLIDVLDYHTYAENITPSIQTVAQIIKDLNFDNILEPIWVSEWGTYNSIYDSLPRALLTAQQLLDFARGRVSGLTIFMFYDWGSMKGLIDNFGNLTETYYVYRLMCRGLIGEKEMLYFQPDSLYNFIIIRDDSSFCFIVVNLNDTLNVDLKEAGINSGSVVIYQYSASIKDSITDSLTFSNGRLSIFAPKNTVLEGYICPQIHDVGITDILTPMEEETLKAGNEIIPCCVVKNFGTGKESFPITCIIETNKEILYEDKEEIDLLPGEEYEKNFNPWVPETEDTIFIWVYYFISLEEDENSENDGMERKSIVISGEQEAISEKRSIKSYPFILYPIQSNPFTKSVRIFYSLPERNRISLKIFNSDGRLVKTLINEEIKTGYQVSIWNGKDLYGRTSPSGIYFLKMESGMFTTIKKIILLW